MIKLFDIFKRNIDLYKVISDENIDLLKKGLNNGIDVNLIDEFGQSPIFRVVYNKCNNQEQMLNILLEYGANPNFQKESDGATVIHYAKSIKIAQILINHGADISINTNSGSTPLQQASTKEMAEFFVQLGVDVNSRDNYGSSPLHDAVYSNFNLVNYLLEQGAEVETKNKYGWTPLISLARTEYADYRDNLEIKRICDLLIEYGADINTVDKENKDAHQHAVEAGNSELTEYLKNKKTKT